jgi:hypothetical protein
MEEDPISTDNNIKLAKESFNKLEVGNIVGNIWADCGNPEMSSAFVLGQGDFIMNAPGGDIVEERFNNLTVGKFPPVGI